MRYFFDTEFIEDGRTIDLISIGMVSEDGRELYFVSSEFDETKANDWVKTHVLNHIAKNQKRHTRKQIADAIVEFVAVPHFENDEYPEFTSEYWKPEFWAYYADYDWVVLCQLYGRMIDLPENFPMFCLDLKQLAFEQSNPKLPHQSGTNHHALEDARWCLEAWEFLQADRNINTEQLACANTAAAF